MGSGVGVGSGVGSGVAVGVGVGIGVAGGTVGITAVGVGEGTTSGVSSFVSAKTAIATMSIAAAVHIEAMRMRCFFNLLPHCKSTRSGAIFRPAVGVMCTYSYLFECRTTSPFSRLLRTSITLWF